jgi:hypothetical protein
MWFILLPPKRYEQKGHENKKRQDRGPSFARKCCSSQQPLCIRRHWPAPRLTRRLRPVPGMSSPSLSLPVHCSILHLALLIDAMYGLYGRCVALARVRAQVTACRTVIESGPGGTLVPPATHPTDCSALVITQLPGRRNGLSSSGLASPPPQNE